MTTAVSEAKSASMNHGSQQQQQQPQPSTATHASAGSQESRSSTVVASQANVMRSLDALEVGWQFVQEYYTILNKDTNRLHCFYNKQSRMLHGVEAETVALCLGHTEIHKRFKELDLQDSRVIISNVDAQASLAGGILVVVLGEMQTRHAPLRKFSQTFYLAEQPNGYYVHNDIFRFLKEGYEATELDAEEEDGLATPGREVDPIPDEPEVLLVHDSMVSHASEHGHADGFANGPDQPIPPATAEDGAGPSGPSEEPTFLDTGLNEARTEPVANGTVMAQDESDVSVMVPLDQNGAEVLVESMPSSSSSTAPKSWASLAETGKERWAKHASEVKATVVTAATPVSTPVAPIQEPVSTSHPSSPVERKPSSAGKPHHVGKEGPSGPAPFRRDREAEMQATVFIRGFTRATKVSLLKEELGKQLGPLRWVDLTSDSSAFIEFVDVDDVKKALETGKITVNGEAVTIEPKEKGGPRRTHNTRGPRGPLGPGGNKLSRPPSKNGPNSIPHPNHSNKPPVPKQ